MHYRLAPEITSPPLAATDFALSHGFCFPFELADLIVSLSVLLFQYSYSHDATAYHLLVLTWLVLTPKQESVPSILPI
jgi:hypothetical protein